MRTVVTLIILAMVASSCLKRRQVTNKKEPTGGGASCPVKTKPCQTPKGVLCMVECAKPKPMFTPNGENSSQSSRCAYPLVPHINGHCAFGPDVTCPNGEEPKIIRNEETCVPIEELAEEQEGGEGTTEESGNGEQPEISIEEEQPLLAGIAAETKLNTIKVNTGCVGGGRCFHPQAKELVCQAHCAKSALGRGYTGTRPFEFVRVDNKGNIKNNNSKLCESSSGATLNTKEGNFVECYLTKGGRFFGVGSDRIDSDRKCDPNNNKCPSFGLTSVTVGKKYMCVVSLNTASDPKQDTNKDYLAIHNKKCDTIEGNNPKLQLEFSL